MDCPALASDVVVVDDDARVRTLMLHVLERAGLSAVGFDSPLEALEHVLAHPPRALLTDFSMPELDGAGLAEDGQFGHGCLRGAALIPGRKGRWKGRIV